MQRGRGERRGGENGGSFKAGKWSTLFNPWKGPPFHYKSGRQYWRWYAGALKWMEGEPWINKRKKGGSHEGCAHLRAPQWAWATLPAWPSTQVSPLLYLLCLLFPPDSTTLTTSPHSGSHWCTPDQPHNAARSQTTLYKTDRTPASQIMQATAWISGRAVVELDPTREAAPNTAMHGGVCLCCYVHWCTVGPLLPQGTWRSPSWESVSVVLMPTRSLNTRSFAFNCSFKVCVCVDSQRRESGTGAFTKTLWKTWPTCCVACNWPLRGPSLMLNAATPPLPSPLHRCSFIKPLW